jgi:hypothetical protein
MKFRKKPVVIEATQWFKMGDHPAVMGLPTLKTMEIGLALGAKSDGILPNKLGWVETLEGGHVVTPGDWIITGVKGEHYPCKPDIFEMTYEVAE